MSRGLSQLGLRAKLALGIAALTLIAVAFVLLVVRREVSEAAGAVLIGGAIGLAATFVAAHLLEEAAARQRRFVSDASHELRTPLTAIRGQLEVLAREPRPDRADVERVSGVAIAELDRIDRLVEDLLALARLDEGEPLRLGEVILPGFLVELAAAAPTAVELGAVPAGALRADPERLTKAIRNLLANAERHAGDGGRVELSARAHGERLTILVDDDGPGIPPAERERVFARFHRSQGARDRDSGGAGLGLAIAASIAERHGGRIRADDSPLGGARIALDLPRFRAKPSGL